VTGRCWRSQIPRKRSQRVVFLATATDAATFTARPNLLVSLRAATAEFEQNYDLLLERTNANPLSPDRNDASTIDSVLFAKPFHLDYFSMGLAANG
jgi:diguanylate cyclase